MRTRRIWNQHTYHVSNVSERGVVPRVESPNWLEPALNNFRQNVQGDGVFNAPDLTVRLDAGTWACPEALSFRIIVRNQGSLAVAAGLAVTLYRGTLAAPWVEPLATLSVDALLLVGGSAELTLRWPVPVDEVDTPHSFFVRVDDLGDGEGEHNNCNGQIDEVQEATMLCAGGDTCVDGICRPPCQAGECPGDLVCVAGVCVPR